MIYLLHHSLDQSANRYPEHEAMRFRGQALTYAQLALQSNQLANVLRDNGVGRGDTVGVFMNKGLETLIAIYGIMKSGAAYVPLDPKSPATRLVNIVQDCQLKAIISEDKLHVTLQQALNAPTSLLFVVGLTTEVDVPGYSWADVATASEEISSPINLVENDLAYIMYTSGTTGTPKGIMHTHHSGLSYVRMSAYTYGINHTDRMSNHPPLHFDMSTFDYLTGPYCGATTVIIPEGYMIFPANLIKLIQDERLTIWYGVPFALIQMVLSGMLEDYDLTSLRWINYGGEPFPANHLRTLMEKLPHVRVSNVYGPAEVNQCTYYHVPPPDTWDDTEQRIPIGYFCNNVQGLVVNDEDQVVADGKMGELVVRTPTMMQGYWNRPERNQNAFYRIKRDSGFEEIYYRTGDLVAKQHSGLLDFFGRKDQQVKVRGFRIELAEVDTVLGNFATVEEASSFVIEAVEGAQLWSAITLIDETNFDETALRRFANQHLPDYAVPTQILIKDSFPRGGTGKVDRLALQREAQTQIDAMKKL